MPTDPFLGHTRLGGIGFVVAEISPYETDLDWSENRGGRFDLVSAT